MAKGIGDFFSKPDETVPDAPEPTPLPETPATGNNIDDKPELRVIEEGTPGEPGHNILVLDEDVQPESFPETAGEQIIADRLAHLPDDRYEAFDANVGTAGTEPYKVTNPLSVETRNAEEALASRDNVVSPDERLSEEDELDLRGQVYDLTEQLTAFDLQVAETQPELDAAKEKHLRLEDDRLTLLGERARVVDEIAAIEAKLNSTGVPAQNDPENPTTSTTPSAVVVDDHRA